jgi:hypothetical protein
VKLRHSFRPVIFWDLVFAGLLPTGALTRQSKIPYCDIVKNITIAVDDETYRRARIKAAERGTSVSALVKQFLAGLAKAADEKERLRRAEDLVRKEITGFRAGDRLRRDDLHNREI